MSCTCGKRRNRCTCNKRGCTELASVNQTNRTMVVPVPGAEGPAGPQGPTGKEGDTYVPELTDNWFSI